MIPKDNGKKRLLGIPTVIDRMVQQAISQVLSRIYEPKFSRTSYGFRPRRGVHDALRESRKNVTEGYKYAVDIDLERFFDTENQSKLIEVLSRERSVNVKEGDKRLRLAFTSYSIIIIMCRPINPEIHSLIKNRTP